jgi:hypothetical protein
MVHQVGLSAGQFRCGAEKLFRGQIFRFVFASVEMSRSYDLREAINVFYRFEGPESRRISLGWCLLDQRRKVRDAGVSPVSDKSGLIVAVI